MDSTKEGLRWNDKERRRKEKGKQENKEQKYTEKKERRDYLWCLDKPGYNYFKFKI